MANLYAVDFAIVKRNAGGSSSPAYAYRRTQRTALVSCANDQAIQAVLNADVPVLAGEVIEILHTHTVTIGTEGQAVLA